MLSIGHPNIDVYLGHMYKCTKSHRDDSIISIGIYLDHIHYAQS